MRRFFRGIWGWVNYKLLSGKEIKYSKNRFLLFPRQKVRDRRHKWEKDNRHKKEFKALESTELAEKNNRRPRGLDMVEKNPPDFTSGAGC